MNLKNPKDHLKLKNIYYKPKVFDLSNSKPEYNPKTLF